MTSSESSPETPQGWGSAQIAASIDHTQLSSTASRADIDRLVEEAQRFQFAAVCVQPIHVARVRKTLAESPSAPKLSLATVVAFPLGAESGLRKAEAAAAAIDQGADEIDFVMNLGAFAEGDETLIRSEFECLNAACRGQAISKVIVESVLWDQASLRILATWARDAGLDFAKTSTGLDARGGATIEAVRALREGMGPKLGVKASGGIRSYDQLIAMVAAGASRIGTSSGVAIVGEAKAR